MTVQADKETVLAALVLPHRVSWQDRADAARDSVHRIAALAEQAEDYRFWNERVRVCENHTSEVVDGECLVCETELLRERLAEAERERDDARGFCLAADADAKDAERQLEQARELVKKLEHELERIVLFGEEDSSAIARAALASLEGGDEA